MNPDAQNITETPTSICQYLKDGSIAMILSPEKNMDEYPANYQVTSVQAPQQVVHVANEQEPAKALLCQAASMRHIARLMVSETIQPVLGAHNIIIVFNST